MEIFLRGSCPYSVPNENHLKFIVKNSMIQPDLDNMASTDDGVKWMCLPHFKANFCWKGTCNSPRGCCWHYLPSPDGVWQHHQQLSKAIGAPPLPPLLHRAPMENKGGFSSQELRLQVEILLGGLSPASSLALVQGAQPCTLQPPGLGCLEGGCQQQQQCLALAHHCLRLLIHCPEMVVVISRLKKRMKLISESDTSITYEVLLSPGHLDCTEDRELALPCFASPCLALLCQQMTPIAPVEVARTRSQSLASVAALAE